MVLPQIEGPTWRVWLAAGALMVVAIGAPRLDVWAGRGIVSGVAVVTVVGLYLGLPETGAVLGVALGLGVLWVAESTGRARLDGLVVVLLAAVIVWAALWGAVTRPWAVTGGIAMLGLFLVGPLAVSVPHAGRGLPRPWDAACLVVLQLVFVVGVARTAAIGDDVMVASSISIAALALLALLAWAVTGGRQR